MPKMRSADPDSGSSKIYADRGLEGGSRKWRVVVLEIGMEAPLNVDSWCKVESYWFIQKILSEINEKFRRNQFLWHQYSIT